MSATHRAVTLITGGAGFVGSTLARRLLSDGRCVLILDNLSRAGVQANLTMLREQFPRRVEVEIADVRDEVAVAHAVERVDEIYHFAAQVAVTSSLERPLEDFEINALGTLNVLEAARRRRPAPPVIFTSTNKVYGGLGGLELKREGLRYVPVASEVRERGIGESQALDFHSPYGCSKGAADQYVLDYARSYGIPAVVFRMSCIYGPHQFGNEDQGWVAHFLIRARLGAPLILFGDGCQVRDVLYSEDLVDAFLAARSRIGALAGTAFNIGGGPQNTVSLLELIALLEDRHALRVRTRFAAWRSGDQRYYESDTSRFTAATGWTAHTSPAQGIEQLHGWLEQALPIERGALVREAPELEVFQAIKR
jgi:CDP-paratose 2-epimerase